MSGDVSRVSVSGGEVAPLTIGDAPVEGGGVALTGNIGQVQLLAAAAAQQLEGNTAGLIEFIRGPLAHTIGRLVRSGDGSREEHADTVISLLQSLRGSQGTGRMALTITRYLLGEEGTTIGYYATLGNLSQLVGSLSPGIELALYHLMMQGIWDLARREQVDDPAYMSNIVTVASNNQATRINDWLEQPATATTEVALKVVTDLASISAVTADAVHSTHGVDVEALLERLGIDSRPGDEVVAVLASLGNAPIAWAGQELESARISSYSAIVGLLESGRRERTPPRFFNAGVSILRTGISRERVGS